MELQAANERAFEVQLYHDLVYQKLGPSASKKKLNNSTLLRDLSLTILYLYIRTTALANLKRTPGQGDPRKVFIGKLQKLFYIVNNT